MKIITNNKPRFLVYGYELPEKEKACFDYISADEIDTHEFIKYRGCFYDFSEILRSENTMAFKGWDGYMSESYFSGLLVKIVNSDSVVVGRYYS